jgi:hypothetical protein
MGLGTELFFKTEKTNQAFFTVQTGMKISAEKCCVVFH